MNDCILALDLGTTHWKAALFYLDGRLAALSMKYFDLDLTKPD